MRTIASFAELFKAYSNQTPGYARMAHDMIEIAKELVANGIHTFEAVRFSKATVDAIYALASYR